MKARSYSGVVVERIKVHVTRSAETSSSQSRNYIVTYLRTFAYNMDIVKLYVPITMRIVPLYT